MAVDQTLLESAQIHGTPTLRFYRWSPACLSLGRNQPPDPILHQAAERGLDVVRRPTGGLAVYHHRELTYSVAAPAELLGRPRQAYRRIHEAIAGALSSLGVSAVLAPDRRSAAAAAGLNWRLPCFSASAAGEILVGGRKLVGSAQRYHGRAILQHGSLLLEDEQQIVRGLGGLRSGAPAAALVDLLPRLPSWRELVAALTQAFREGLGIPLARGGLAAHEQTRVIGLTAHFRSDSWTSRH